MGISMGMVGGLRPPQEFARVLREFDPDLEAEWNYASQSWWITQTVKRCRPVGTADGIHLSCVDDVKVPVMQISSFPGALDSRILAMLEKERAVTLKEYEKLLIQRQKDKKAHRSAETAKSLDYATEDALSCWYDPTIRNQVGLPPRVKGWSPDGNTDRTDNQNQSAA